MGNGTGDNVYVAFLEKQREQGMKLAGESEVLDLLPLAEGTSAYRASPDTDAAVERYIAQFTCKGLVRTPDGEIKEADQFAVGVWFTPDYLRTADPFKVLTWLGPRNVWHPNISDKAPFICIGRLCPGMPLGDILYQCYEIITYQKVTMDDALNGPASAWARHHQNLFPVDARPLKRRRVDFSLEAVQ